MADEMRDIPPGDCILFATADWDEPYWTNKQHTANELAKLGWRVLYVESVGLRVPRSGSSRDWGRLFDRLKKGLKSFFLGPSMRSERVWVVSPLLIPAGHSHPVWGRVNQRLLRFILWRSLVGKSFKRPIVWTYHPFMLNIREKNWGPLIYHCVDDLSAVPGVDAKMFKNAEQNLLIKAGAVFATAPALKKYCSKFNDSTYYLPNVVDAEHFGKALMQQRALPQDLARIPEPRLGYHGVLSDFKLDFELLTKVAVESPKWHIVLIGEEREGQKSEHIAALKKLNNVHFLGYKKYSTLPSYLRGVQVGLLPSMINEYTRSMFPMKYFEYLAAGVPVVSTPLDFTKQHSYGLEVGASPECFIKAITCQLNKGRLTQNEISLIIADNTWVCRTKKMLEIALAQSK